MIKTKLKMDPSFRMLRPRLPLLLSGKYSSEEIDRIREICSTLARGIVPGELPDRMPEWLIHLINHVSRTGKLQPELRVPWDPEGGPDPERMMFVDAIGHPLVHGLVPYVVRLAVATDLDRPVRHRTVRGEAVPVVTDLQSAERHLALFTYGCAVLDQVDVADFGNYGMKLALLREESARLENYEHEMGVATQA